MKYFVICIVILTGISVISIENAFAEEQILIHIENDVRNLFYTGENIMSAFFDPDTASVIFETGENANLHVKAPKIYKYGEILLVLRNGEEVDAIKDSDECFYYITYHTKVPEKIEIVFAHWPEATALVENCEIFTIPPPLKQMKFGIKLGHIICDEDRIPTWNIHYKPACIFPDSEMELLKRGWAKLRLILPDSGDPALEMKLTGNNEMSYRLTGQLKVGDEWPLSENQKREIVWQYAQKYYPKKQFLEYSITPNQYHYYQGEKIQFDLLEWGNYYGCWDLKLRIFENYNEVFHEEILKQYCIESTSGSKTGVFNSYSTGQDIKELVCEKPGYYMIEVSNDKIFPPTIIENFACLENEN